MNPQVRTVGIDELSSSPVPIHLHSHKQTEHVSASLDSCKREQVIRVAELEGRMYIVDGHMLVEAHRRRGKKSVKVRVYKVKNTREVVSLHIRHNMSHPPNPVRLIRAIMYMRKSGDSDRQIAEALNANKLVADILRFKINEDAVKELEKILVEISKLYYTVQHSFPAYLVEWIFRQAKEEQHAATVALRQAISISLDVPERKFTWPTPMEVRIMQKHNQDVKTRSVEGIPLMLSNDGVRGRPMKTTVDSSVISKSPSTDEIRKIGGDNTPSSRQKFAFKCPHGSLLYIDGKSRVFHVEDDNKDNVINLRHIDVENDIYKISKEHCDFMRVKDGRIFVKKCTPAQARRHLSKLKEMKMNVCILSAKEL